MDFLPAESPEGGGMLPGGRIDLRSPVPGIPVPGIPVPGMSLLPLPGAVGAIEVPVANLSWCGGAVNSLERKYAAFPSGCVNTFSLSS